MIWLNTKCDNSEGNMCVCPYCRCRRELADPETGLLPMRLPDKWLLEFARWEFRTQELENNMKKRFPERE